jgi:hypothetical protein
MIAIENRERQLDKYFNDAEKFQENERMQSELAKFGAVLICGYLERSVETIVINRLQKKCHPTILSFVKSHFKSGTNYKRSAIVELLKRFETDWATKFEKQVPEEEKLAQSVQSVYALRNSIAHGGTANCGLKTVKTYYDDAQKVVKALIASTS